MRGTRKDGILWGALGCALVSTAHAEYTLATAAHFNEYVALAVPGALDLYVVRALQQRRDVFVAVLAMVAANVASHLIAGGVLQVRWPVIAAVGAVAPLIVWRVYSLKYTRTRQELLWGLEAGAGPEDTGAVKAPECAPSTPPPAVLRPASALASTAPAWAPGYHLDGCDGLHQHEGPFHCNVRASALASTAPDHVPADWMEDEYPETHPSAPQVRALDDLFQKLGPPSAPHSKTSAVPYLAPVPDLPPEYEASAVHLETSTPVLRDTDWEYLPGAQEYVDKYSPATVKGLRRQLSIGQDRAERLLAHLGVRP